MMFKNLTERHCKESEATRNPLVDKIRRSPIFDSIRISNDAFNGLPFRSIQNSTAEPSRWIERNCSVFEAIGKQNAKKRKGFKTKAGNRFHHGNESSLK